MYTNIIFLSFIVTLHFLIHPYYYSLYIYPLKFLMHMNDKLKENHFINFKGFWTHMEQESKGSVFEEWTFGNWKMKKKKQHEKVKKEMLRKVRFSFYLCFFVFFFQKNLYFPLKDRNEMKQIIFSCPC